MKINGIETAYLDEGSGEPVVLFHGWGACKESLGPLVGHLKETHRVIAPDLPGCGQSAEPAEPYGVDDYKTWALAFLKAVGAENPVLMGHSNGGRVIIRLLAGGYPAKKAVLIDSAGLRARHGAMYYFKVYSYKAAKKVLKLPVFDKTGLYEKLVKSAGSEDYKNASPVMRQTMNRLLSTDLTADLSKIKIPTLLIWGENDTATPLSDGKKMDGSFPMQGLWLFPAGAIFLIWTTLAKQRRLLTIFWPTSYRRFFAVMI